MFIFIGNECSSYDSQNVFTRWLNNGVFEKVYLIEGLNQKFEVLTFIS